jgi:hypothetical protein
MPNGSDLSCYIMADEGHNDFMYNCKKRGTVQNLEVGSWREAQHAHPLQSSHGVSVSSRRLFHLLR